MILIREVFQKANARQWSKKRRAVTKMVAIVTVVFSVCWLPITLYIMSANVFENRTAFLYYYKMIAHSFAYLNSAVNPLIYAFLNRSFRNNCGDILSKPTCLVCCQKGYHERQEQLTKQRNANNYRATNGQNRIIENQLPSIPNGLLNDDFSDGEYEPFNRETINGKYLMKDLIITKEMNSNNIDQRPLTTSL